VQRRVQWRLEYLRNHSANAHLFWEGNGTNSPSNLRFITPQIMPDTADSPTKKRELSMFLFLTLVLAPVLAVIIVAGYGFCVWMYQIIMGPPSV
jgi:periplasmic nitrate reductase NapE